MPASRAIVAAVTGTSGKTSTAEFTRQIWQLLGRRAASLGTLGLVAPGGSEYLSLTTLDPIDLHRRLAGLADSGIDHLAMEASSHGLDQFRLDGVNVAAAAFTNLSRDHLDYHGTMAAYLASKQRLFAEVMASGSMAVLNRDAPEFAQLAAASTGHGHRLITFGRQSGDLRLVEQQPEAEGQRLDIEAFGRRDTLFFPVAGAFQADNLLAALGLAIACGEAVDRVLAVVPRLAGVHGRIERVAQHPNGAPIYVDYAHKPGALEAVLTALRPHARGRLVVVFGCGGDRDRGKRPLMGEVADAARRPGHRHRRQSAQRGSGGDPPRGPGRRPGCAGDRRPPGRDPPGRRRAGARRPAGHRRQGPRDGPDHRRLDPSLRRQRRGPRRGGGRAMSTAWTAAEAARPPAGASRGPATGEPRASPSTAAASAGRSVRRAGGPELRRP